MTVAKRPDRPRLKAPRLEPEADDQFRLEAGTDPRDELDRRFPADLGGYRPIARIRRHGSRAALGLFRVRLRHPPEGPRCKLKPS